jgi:phage virion morphogenesis protein
MITIEVDDKEIRWFFDRVNSQMANTAPLMREISEKMRDAVEENFEQEGRPKWEPLSETTKKIRQKKGTWPGSILQDSGQLAASISASNSKTEAIVGTNKIYGPIQQFGGRAGRGKKVKIPPRPFLKLTDNDIEEIKKIISEYLFK